MEQLDNPEVVENFEKSRKLGNHIKGGDVKLEGTGEGGSVGGEGGGGEGHSAAIMKEDSSMEGFKEDKGVESEKAAVKEEEVKAIGE